MKIKLSVLSHQAKKKELSLNDMYNWEILDETFLSPFPDIKKGTTDSNLEDFNYSFIKLIYISVN